VPVARHDERATVVVAELDRHGEVVESHLEELRCAEVTKVMPANIPQAVL
jgi:hypothetical protein